MVSQKVMAGVVSVALMIAGGVAAANESTAYRDISERYEAIRLLLLDDTLEGVGEHASAIGERAANLARAFTAEGAGVEADNADEAKALLPEIAAAAERLASTSDIGAARAEYFELSKPMGRYRRLAGTEGSVVAYCAMAKKAWIQPEGELGNPYMGQSMPKCGEVIAD